jgi:hypothetical protein
MPFKTSYAPQGKSMLQVLASQSCVIGSTATLKLRGASALRLDS